MNTQTHTMTSSSKWIYLTTLILTLILLGYQYISFRTTVEENERLGVEHIQNNMTMAEDKFEDRLQEIMNFAEELAGRIEHNSIDSLQMMEYLEQVMKESTDIFGFGVCYEPYQFKKDKELFSPYWIKPDGKLQLKFIDEDYNYSETEWYSIPLNTGAQWFEPPYFGKVSQIMMAEYSVPFYRTNENGEKRPIGIVFINYSLEDITSAIRKLIVGNLGYGFMLSEGGTLIAHPQAKLVLGGDMNIDKMAQEWKEEKLIALFNQLEVNGNKYIKATDPYDGKSVRIFMQKINVGGWRLGAVFVEEAFKADSDYLNKKIVVSSVLVILILTILCAYILHNNHFNLRIASQIVVVYSIIVVLVISGIWTAKLLLPFNIYHQQSSYALTDIPGLQRFLQDQDSLRTYYHEPEVIKIPTGVHINQLVFNGSHNVRLSGIIWQVYDLTIDSVEIKPALYFPGIAPDAEVLEIEKLYSHIENGNRIVGWHFRIEIRKQMEYNLYPVDREIITLLIEHPSYNKNVQLIPDLDAYKSIITSNLPGIEKGIVLPEWITEQSYYDLKKIDLNSNLGVLSNVNDNYKYQLGFNLVLKRKFLWPAMGNIIPLITIVILLFLALVSISKQNPDKKGILFTGFGFLELCAAFLFVAILTHIDLRSNLVVNYIIYMDYFYFHIYLAIISCSIAVVLLNKDINRKQLLIVRHLFWPVLLLSLFIFTAIVFY